MANECYLCLAHNKLNFTRDSAQLDSTSLDFVFSFSAKRSKLVWLDGTDSLHNSPTTFPHTHTYIHTHTGIHLWQMNVNFGLWQRITITATSTMGGAKANIITPTLKGLLSELVFVKNFANRFTQCSVKRLQ